MLKRGRCVSSSGGVAGGAMFVGCVVAGAVILASGGVPARGALMRDMTAVMIAVSFIALVLASGSVRLLLNSCSILVSGWDGRLRAGPHASSAGLIYQEAVGCSTSRLVSSSRRGYSLCLPVQDNSSQAYPQHDRPKTNQTHSCFSFEAVPKSPAAYRRPCSLAFPRTLLSILDMTARMWGVASGHTFM